VDTGSEFGLALAPQKWQAWKETNPHQAMTLTRFSTLGDGLVFKEEAWANQVAFGTLILTGVPVMEATPTQLTLEGRQCEGLLGLAALRRLDFIVDSEHGVAYLRSKGTPPPPYKHNRSGAEFVPSDLRGDELIARVVEGSPAEEAGIRNGDVLMKIDELDVTMRNIDALRKLWMRSGTKINITLKRDGRIFKTTVTLRDILPPVIAKEKH
jgi:membrane-associated protease RseP (regulator of RpoE activity)